MRQIPAVPRPLPFLVEPSMLIRLLVVLAAAGLAFVGGPSPLAAQDPPRPHSIVVQPGDTLTGIALRVYGSADAVDRIAAANKLADPDRVFAGSSLLLPDTATASTASSATTTAAASGATTTATVVGGARQVVVAPGDTLSAIAVRLYGSAAYAAPLAAANGITDPNRVYAGMKLTAPATLTAPAAPAAAAAASAPLTGKRICLDPGHGGDESGAAYDFGGGAVLREADVTLDIARTLKGWLASDGASVTMTRAADVYLGLDERAAVCNAAGADIAVSVHLNGADPISDGSLTLYGKPLDRRLAGPLADVLYAGLVRNAPSLPFTAYGSRQFDGRVLLMTVMPAVIVEPVFLTNPAEARALAAPSTQSGSRRNQIAVEIYRGLRAYFAGGR